MLRTQAFTAFYFSNMCMKQSHRMERTEDSSAVMLFLLVNWCIVHFLHIYYLHTFEVLVDNKLLLFVALTNVMSITIMATSHHIVGCHSRQACLKLNIPCRCTNKQTYNCLLNKILTEVIPSRNTVACNLTSPLSLSHTLVFSQQYELAL